MSTPDTQTDQPSDAPRRVVCTSGLEGERSRLRTRYTSAEEWESYAETWGLHRRLGYGTPAEAWEANPLIESSTNPRDFRRVAT